MKGKVTVLNDHSREIRSGTQIRDGLDHYTVERTTHLRRNWLMRLLEKLGLGRGRARGRVPAVREDRLEER